MKNLTEKTFLFAKTAFAMAVDERMPKTVNTLLDEKMMLRMGLKPTRIMCKRFAYGGVATRIVAEARFTAQTIFNGVQKGNNFLKVFVVRDLCHYYGVDAIAGGKLYTQLSNTNDDDSFMGSAAVDSPPKSPSKSPDKNTSCETGKNATAKAVAKKEAVAANAIDESNPKKEVIAADVIDKSTLKKEIIAAVTSDSKEIFFRSLHPEMYTPPRPSSPSSQDSSAPSTPTSVGPCRCVTCCSPSGYMCEDAYSRELRKEREDKFEMKENLNYVQAKPSSASNDSSPPSSCCADANFIPAYEDDMHGVASLVKIPDDDDIYENISFVHEYNQFETEVVEKSCDYCRAVGKDKNIWSTHDKYGCYDIFPEKRRSKTNTRMLSIPIMADKNNTWDLQDARSSVESLYFNQMRGQKEEEKQRPALS